MGVAGADLGLEARHEDARVAGERPGRLHAGGERGQAARFFQGIAGTDQPPDAVEADALQRELARMDMPAVRRVEGAAEEPDAQARRMGRKTGDRHRCSLG